MLHFIGSALSVNVETNDQMTSSQQYCHGEVMINVGGALGIFRSSLLELELERSSTNPQDYNHSELLIMVGTRLVSLHGQVSSQHE